MSLLHDTLVIMVSLLLLAVILNLCICILYHHVPTWKDLLCWKHHTPPKEKP